MKLWYHCVLLLFTSLVPGAERPNLLFIYTDGVTEAENKDGDLFGEDRLVEFLSLEKSKGVARLQESARKRGILPA